MGKAPFGYVMLGTQLVASVLIGSFIGRWLDIKFHSEPWCFAGGFLLGATAGFYELFKATREGEGG